MITNMSLRNKSVLLENPAPPKEEVKSGLILPTKIIKPINDPVSVVVAVSDDCDEVKVGDKVCFNKGLKETIGDSEHESKYLLIKESNIHFIIHEN